MMFEVQVFKFKFGFTSISVMIFIGLGELIVIDILFVSGAVEFG